MSKLKWHIGDVIQKARESRGLTRAELARKVAITPYWMGRIERTGRCQSVTLEQIAKALQWHTADIYAEVPGAPSGDGGRSVCSKHRPAFVKLDHLIHRGIESDGELCRAVVVIIDAFEHAVDQGFSAHRSVEEHIEAGLLGPGA